MGVHTSFFIFFLFILFSLSFFCFACRLRFFRSVSVPVTNSLCARCSCLDLALLLGGGCGGCNVTLYLKREAGGVGGSFSFFLVSLILCLDSCHSLLIDCSLIFVTDCRHSCLVFTFPCSSSKVMLGSTSISRSPSLRFSKMCLTACLMSLCSPRNEEIFVTTFGSKNSLSAHLVSSSVRIICPR